MGSSIAGSVAWVRQSLFILGIQRTDIDVFWRGGRCASAGVIAASRGLERRGARLFRHDLFRDFVQLFLSPASAPPHTARRIVLCPCQCRRNLHASVFNFCRSNTIPDFRKTRHLKKFRGTDGN